jgi:hypothetical protein
MVLKDGTSLTDVWNSNPTILNLTGDSAAIEGLTVAEGHRMFVVKARVDPAAGWSSLVTQVSTHGADEDAYELAEFFPPEQGEPRDWYLYGLFIGLTHNNRPAVDWGEANNLKEAASRQVLSAVRDHPDLNLKVGMGCTGFVSLKPSTIDGRQRVCYVGFGGQEDEEREVSTLSYNNASCNDRWYMFARECRHA